MSETRQTDVRIGLIGGSGLGAALAGQTVGTRHDLDTPFGKPSDVILETTWAGLPVFFLSRHGPGHVLNPTQIPYRANLFALKQLGVTHILASGAVGSLREEFKPRDLVIPDQIIDKTHRRIGTFYDHAAVHVEFAEPFCPVLRQMLIDTAASSGAAHDVHTQGCYVCMEGPAFGTRAESLMHRVWGGDLIGMTAMPEAKLAREAEMAYALVALVTDYDCWRRAMTPAPDQPGNTPAPLAHDPAVLLKEIIGNLDAATGHAIDLMRRTVQRLADHRDTLQTSPALHALQLAIWSDKKRIPTDQVARLATLWGRYF